MSDQVLWDKVAPVYEDEVFDVYKSDKKGVLKKMVQSHANKTHLAIDFGCGLGKALPMLSPLFKEIVAVDVSQNLLDMAEKLNFKNVHLHQADLAEKKVKLPKAEFLLCCNVSISSNNARNFQMLRNAMNSLKIGGTAVFVLPSLESMSFATWMLIKIYQKEGVKFNDIPKQDISHLSPEFHPVFKDGVFNIEDTPTKHYLLPEIISFFNNDRFQIETIDRIEYDWGTELDELPKNVKAADPWDWLVEVKRIG